MNSIEITIVATCYIVSLSFMFYAGKIAGIRMGVRESIKIMHEMAESIRGNDE